MEDEFEELLVKLIETLEDFLDEVEFDDDEEFVLSTEMASENDTIH